MMLIINIDGNIAGFDMEIVTWTFIYLQRLATKSTFFLCLSTGYDYSFSRKISSSNACQAGQNRCTHVGIMTPSGHGGARSQLVPA